ncbi:putative jacalin-like lectin [Lyophyllum shimeji]|uniref:Jacalin-like lectin n=1 Tax=Lyophyllum shimeji TaxID=47721 RepID=A0A9P3PFS1_LYOSH|nr:putative jacalin-like lectin [Lyophyllum shimeji]
MTVSKSRFWIGLSALISSAAAAQTQGSFSLLSYNVAGLPEALSSGNPVVDTPLISPRLKPYNIIHVQEDFNYHAALYANDTHAYRTPTSGGAAIGSGLNTLSDFPYIDLDRVTWKNCNLNSGDCLTPKGFTFMRVRIDDGAWIDLYNLHTDAGDQAGDITARASNFAQVSAYMQTWSVGMPVVVMGDTNSRYTRPGDSDTLHGLLSANGLSDAWVTNVRGGSFPASGAPALVCDFPFAAGTPQAQMVACEVVDKILVRGSAFLTFEQTSYANENDAFLSSAVRLADPVGGPHGDAFNDIPSIIASSAAVPKITAITVRGANRVDGISYAVQHANGTSTAVTHGGTGGTPVSLSLGPDEYVTQVQACSGKHNNTTRVFFLSLVTNRGRTVQAGKTTSECVVAGVPGDDAAGGKEWGLVAFWGREGDEMDRVGGAAY